MRRHKALITLGMAVGIVMSLPNVAQGQAAGKEKTPSLTSYTLPAARDGDDKNYQAEVDICNEGLKIFPDSPDLRELLAEGLGGLGKYEEAIKIFEELTHSEKAEDRAILMWSRAGYQRVLIQEGNAVDVTEDAKKKALAKAKEIGDQIVELHKQEPPMLAKGKE